MDAEAASLRRSVEGANECYIRGEMDESEVEAVVEANQ